MLASAVLARDCVAEDERASAVYTADVSRRAGRADAAAADRTAEFGLPFRLHVPDVPLLKLRAIEKLPVRRTAKALSSTSEWLSGKVSNRERSS